MSIYRFIGDCAEIYNPAYQFRRFGQKADLDDALAKHVVSQGVQLIPEAEFEAIGFTDAELAKYPSAISHMNATDEFKRKKATAMVALAEYRQSLAAPVAAQAATPAKEGE
jgi:hypothetical protein